MKFTIPLVILLLFSLQLTAQESPARKGASIISLGGSYIKDNKDKSTDLRLGLSASYFVINKLFVGFDYSLYQAKSDRINERFTGLGPTVGYAIRKTGVIPYISAGLQFGKSTIIFQGITTLNVNAKLEQQKYAAYGLTGGVIVPLKKYIGIIGGLNYTRSFSSGDIDFELINASVGVVVLIY